jgi:hypothetical protein
MLRFTVAHNWTAGIDDKHRFLNESFTPQNPSRSSGHLPILAIL